MARNVSVYSVYNVAGSYYFGSDRAAALDSGYPYANALLGSIFGYGDDNKKQVNHAHYTQVEWFIQDTWKIGRRLTIDPGLRFHRVGDLHSSGATLGLFRKEERYLPINCNTRLPGSRSRPGPSDKVQNLSPRADWIYLMPLDDLWALLFRASSPPASGLSVTSCSFGRGFAFRFFQLHLAATPCGSASVVVIGSDWLLSFIQ